MRTTVDIDERLLAAAMKASDTNTKKDAIATALREYVRSRRRQELRSLMGRWDDFGLTLADLEKIRRAD